MQEYPTLAAIDLGSNSFHLQVGRVDGDQLFYLDAHKESVRLAGGLSDDKLLDAASQERALACLARFGERLKGMPEGAVRAVGTSALRVAKNAPAFIERAKATLGFDIDVVAGREEARLIYLGVSHSLPMNTEPRLVVDIGGGSTECIIGVGYEPRDRESLRMGCVVFSNRFFPGGEMEKSSVKAAVTAARMEVQQVVHQFRRGLWQEAVGSSGSARSMGEILFQNGISDGQISADGLKWLRERLAKAGSFARLDLDGLKDDRKPVLAGAVAIMSGLFQELEIDTMTVAQGAMREGILWDLLGRVHNHDMRDVTVTQFVRRYHVDGKQARRVERLAARLYMQLTAGDRDGDGEAIRWLNWAARLHEIGIQIAHSGLHKHGAYILENADMPGFGRRDQARLAMLVRASRGGLEKLGFPPEAAIWPLILCLRLAILLNGSRSDAPIPDLKLTCAADGNCELTMPADWMAANPLSKATLYEELRAWQAVRPVVRLGALQVRS
ncbi:exopolyphosphatase [Parasulfuritortus cantonensis]|uniref:Exopolyphosphatase n=1 Tax=Parasulfuritortus cantonensis TaxID=2528202 RepID=A0A4R1BLY0_9PROT|nr:exopolyphosphatase [Parasulfuritortus cantonensis]TCJ18399.1 exopolyphosphatase [Parasulfuritortus cantonensis]